VNAIRVFIVCRRLIGYDCLLELKISASFFARSVFLQNDTTDEVGGTDMDGLFQPMHLIVIFAIVLLIFGPRKLPEIGKGLGESIRGFKKAISEDPSHNEAKTEEAKKLEEKR